MVEEDKAAAKKNGTDEVFLFQLRKHFTKQDALNTANPKILEK